MKGQKVVLSTMNIAEGKFCFKSCSVLHPEELNHIIAEDVPSDKLDDLFKQLEQKTNLYFHNLCEMYPVVGTTRTRVMRFEVHPSQQPDPQKIASFVRAKLMSCTGGIQFQDTAEEVTKFLANS